MHGSRKAGRRRFTSCACFLKRRWSSRKWPMQRNRSRRQETSLQTMNRLCRGCSIEGLGCRASGARSKGTPRAGLTSPPSFLFCRIPCCRASISRRPSSINPVSFSRMKSRSRFINRTGTAAPTAASTRSPVALAMACSLGCFSRSVFHLSSSRRICCFG
jgi:hypothetical protein